MYPADPTSQIGQLQSEIGRLQSELSRKADDYKINEIINRLKVLEDSSETLRSQNDNLLFKTQELEEKIIRLEYRLCA